MLIFILVIIKYHKDIKNVPKSIAVNGQVGQNPLQSLIDQTIERQQSQSAVMDNDEHESTSSVTVPLILYQ